METASMTPEAQKAYAEACGLIESGSYDGAIKSLQDLLLACPGHARAHNDIGVLYSQRGEPKLALEHMTASLRLDPANAGTMMNVADVCLSIGMNAHAAKMYRLVLAGKPDDSDAAEGLSRAVGGTAGGAESGAKSATESATTEGLIIDGVDYTPLAEPRHTSRPELVSLYWNYHPRYRFLKTLPRGCRLLDAGAGPGGLILWKEWLPPRREDIRMCAVDMIRGELFDRYEDFQICDLDRESIKYGTGSFNAILLSHVLEHIKDEKTFFRELGRVLVPGGRIYVEVPTPESLHFPGRQIFLERGIGVSTVNFFDDSTHLRTFSLGELSALADETGFNPVETGKIGNRYIEDDLLSFGIRNRDQELATYGLWSKLGFAHYMVAERA
jgi:SAM-dependent methyltransferase